MTGSTAIGSGPCPPRGFRIQDAGCRVQGAGCRVQGAGCRVQSSGWRVEGGGWRVDGSEWVREPQGGVVCLRQVASLDDLVWGETAGEPTSDQTIQGFMGVQQRRYDRPIDS